MSAAAVRTTSIIVPPMYQTLLTSGETEIGGVLLFEKKTEPEQLLCNSIMVALGTHKDVQVSAILDRFKEQKAWVMFHTHPVSTVNPVHILSADDLHWIIVNTLTHQYSDDDVPVVAHLLITQHYALLTKLGFSAFQYQFRLINAFKAYHTAVFGPITDKQLIQEYLKGIHVLSKAHEAYFISGLASISLTDQRAMLAYETRYINEFLDNCAFSPDDEKTKLLLNGIPPAACRYTDWMKTSPKLPARRADIVSEEGKGLFYSWMLPIEKFKESKGITIFDQGGLYDLVENWDVTRPGPLPAEGHTAGEGAMMDAESPGRVATAPVAPAGPPSSGPSAFSIPISYVTPPGSPPRRSTVSTPSRMSDTTTPAAPEGKDTFSPHQIAEILRSFPVSELPPPPTPMSDSPFSSPRRTGGTRRKKHRRPRTYRSRA